MLAKFWKDEGGIVAIEYLFLATVIALGLVIGFGNLEGALNAEYSELGNSVLSLNQGYTILSQSGCKVFKGGSAAFDTPGSVGYGATGVTLNSINVFACFAGSVVATTVP